MYAIVSHSQIKSSDGLPQHVCRKCVSELRIAFAYKKRCEDSDYKLRDYFHEHSCGAEVKLEAVDLPPEELVDCNWLENVQSVTDAEALSVIKRHPESDEAHRMSSVNIDTFAQSDDDGSTGNDLEANASEESSNVENNAPNIEEETLSKSAKFHGQEDSAVERNPSTVANEVHRCAVCLKPFKFYCDYIQHKSVHDILPDKKFTCDICHVKFTRLYNLK